MKTAEPLFEFETGGLSARAIPARGSSVLAVVFSQVRVPRGSFGLSRLFARTAHACLFLNQPDNAWYRGAEKAVDDAIARAADLCRPDRIVLYGSSMGGWGALSAAARHPGADAVVFAPDFRIGEPGSRSAEAGLRPEAADPDLAALLAVPRTGTVDILIGLFDPYDAGVAVRVAALPLPRSVRLVTAASAHEIHDHLYSVNVVRRIISTFTRDPAVEVAARGLALPLDNSPAYAAFARLAGELAAGRPPDPDAIDALGLSGNPGVALLKAEALAAGGHVREALDLLAALDVGIEASTVLSTLPKRYRKQVPRRRIEWLDGLGRHAEAQKVATTAGAVFPNDQDFAARARN
ncbi:hypothetical protein [Chthonobacter albigriseus]|uniref:hypothetical protein n=1 Tax=Chthonobacter albigriseus TaxID=1683161 RepID=UPI0015EF461C|nr:hypothetical protein [Chthonobacter albigriseus]